ncbi:MAG: hypothetical protein ABIB61_03995 [Candidatus Shapirobacteria bacterium]
MPKWSLNILTDNALAKMKKHGLSQGEIQGAFERYQKKENGPISGCTSFIRILRSREIGVIARQKENGLWCIVSVWQRKLYK